MNAPSRTKRKLRESPRLWGGAVPATDQQRSHAVQGARRAPALQLAVPQLDQYYPGTSIPRDGWFHACSVCRCWTAFAAAAGSGEAVPLCRRCLPHQQQTSLWDADAVHLQQQQLHQQEPTNKTVSRNYSMHSDAASVRPPAPATAMLQGLCQSPACCSDPTFLSPAAAAAALARLSEIAAAAAGTCTDIANHSSSDNSSSSSRQLVDDSNRHAMEPVADLLYKSRGWLTANIQLQQQQQQGVMNKSRRCSGYSPSHVVSRCSFQQLLDGFILSLLPAQQQQQQQGLGLSCAGSVTAAQESKPNTNN